MRLGSLECGLKRPEIHILMFLDVSVGVCKRCHVASGTDWHVRRLVQCSS